MTPKIKTKRSELYAVENIKIMIIKRDAGTPLRTKIYKCVLQSTSWTPASEGSNLELWFMPDSGVTLVAAPAPALVDGDMEAVGVTAWNYINDVRTKETDGAHGGTQ